MDEGEKNETKVDEDRRTFLKVTVVASAALAVGGMAALAKVVGETGADTTSTTSTGPASSFPTYLIQDVTTGQTANVNTMTTDKILTFNYPLDNEPNIIMKLGVAVDHGIGPDSDIIAYSDICQHLGCNPGFVYQGGQPPFCNTSYVAQGPVMYCCCHGSIYDVANDAKVIGGPAPRPVPRVMLGVDSSGNIYAIGMTPPVIWSGGGEHGPLGSDDVSLDLQGGTLVPSTTVSLTSTSESS